MGCTFSLSEPQPPGVSMTFAAASVAQQRHSGKQTAADLATATSSRVSQPAVSHSAVHTSIAECGKGIPADSTSGSPSSSSPNRSRPSSTSSSSTLPSSSSSSSALSSTATSASAVRVQSLLCPIHPVRQPRPLSCPHCMRTSTALTSYPSVPPCSSLPFVTAAQITSHWSSRFVEHQLPTLPTAAATQPYSDNVLPATSASYFSYLHSATSASLIFPSAASSTYSTSHHSHSASSYSPTFLPSIAVPPKQPPLAVRRKQHFSVDEECSRSHSGSESSTDLAVLSQQLSAVRQQRTQRRLNGSRRRDDSSSAEQSTSDSDNGAADGKRSDRRRAVSVARVSEQRESAAEVEDDEGGDVDDTDDDLTSPSTERADELELSVCQKTRQIKSPTREEKTNEDVAYHSITPGACVQFVDHSKDGW